MDIEKAIKTVRAVQDGFRRLEEEKSRLQSEHAEILDPLKIIRPFKNLNFDVSEILNFKYIHYRFGRIEKQYLQKFEKYIYDNLDTLFIKCGEDEMYVPRRCLFLTTGKSIRMANMRYIWKMLSPSLQRSTLTKEALSCLFSDKPGTDGILFHDHFERTWTLCFLFQL